jgi:hypothetical protein
VVGVSPKVLVLYMSLCLCLPKGWKGGRRRCCEVDEEGCFLRDSMMNMNLATSRSGGRRYSRKTEYVLIVCGVPERQDECDR